MGAAGTDRGSGNSGTVRPLQTFGKGISDRQRKIQLQLPGKPWGENKNVCINPGRSAAEV